MSELHSTTNAAKIRQSLLATVSAFVLAACGWLPEAQAADTGRPTVWIEGGWHFESVTGDADTFAPPLDALTRATGLPSLTAIENTLGRTYGAEGSISFQPKSSDWVFTASARYGRSQSTRRSINEKTIAGPPLKKTTTYRGCRDHHFNFPCLCDPFGQEQRGAFDRRFSGGKGCRHWVIRAWNGYDRKFWRQICADERQIECKLARQSRRGVQAGEFVYGPFHKYYIQIPNHRSAASMERTDSLHALGPSLSMKNTTGLLGTVDDGQIALDWG